MGLEVERQVSMRVAQLLQELDAVKVELQQLRGKVQFSPVSTSEQQSQSNVSNVATAVVWNMRGECTRSLMQRSPCSVVKQICIAWLRLVDRALYGS